MGVFFQIVTLQEVLIQMQNVFFHLIFVVKHFMNVHLKVVGKMKQIRGALPKLIGLTIMLGVRVIGDIVIQNALRISLRILFVLEEELWDFNTGLGAQRIAKMVIALRVFAFVKIFQNRRFLLYKITNNGLLNFCGHFSFWLWISIFYDYFFNILLINKLPN